MSGKIPVTVISGFLGSGKTTLLNRLLSAKDVNPADSGAAGRTIVIVNELGAVGLDHLQVRHIADNVVLLESGCICCSVRGALVDTLRDLFLDALHKKIPPFSRVIIETTGIADPAPVMYTLSYERFLSDRYVYDGCISVIDGVYGAEQLRRDPVAVQQAVLADALVISKTDLATAQGIAALQQQLSTLNPQALQHFAGDRPGLADLLRSSSLRTGVAQPSAGQGLWATGAVRQPFAHGDVKTFAMTWGTPLQRSKFIRAISRVQADTSLELLRVKGVLWFQGDDFASAIHGVHSQLYPVEPLNNGIVPISADDQHESALVLIFRGNPGDRLAVEMADLLPGGRLRLSSSHNFVQ